MSDPVQPAFRDHFSRDPASYARFRPLYPVSLFEELAALAPARDHAWDCATGTGQAAVSLADHFELVTATDASPSQVAAARPHPRVSYRVAAADGSGLADREVQLVTVAQALHWLDLDRFWAEARRVLVPGGVVAAWSYGSCEISPEVDAVVDRLYSDVLGPYWPPERRMVETGYAGVALPFERLATGEHAMERWVTLAEFEGYLGTWSAVGRYRADRGSDALDVVRQPLADAWGDPGQARRVRWPLSVLAGRRD